MVLVNEPEVRQELTGTTGRRCSSCPRCTDSNAGFCKQGHAYYNGMHPVCRRCGHCVLRGTHDDDVSDLVEEKA